jgi:hypothetical protein
MGRRRASGESPVVDWPKPSHNWPPTHEVPMGTFLLPPLPLVMVSAVHETCCSQTPALCDLHPQIDRAISISNSTRSMPSARPARPTSSARSKKGGAWFPIATMMAASPEPPSTALRLLNQGQPARRDLYEFTRGNSSDFSRCSPRVSVPGQKPPCVAQGDAHSTHREAAFGGSARDVLAALV